MNPRIFSLRLDQKLNGGQWHTSDSIGFYDLIDVSKAANLAFDWISQQEADQHNDQAVTS